MVGWQLTPDLPAGVCLDDGGRHSIQDYEYI